MSWQALRAAVDLLARSRRPRVALVFSGGEPLLEPALLRRGIAYACHTVTPRNRLSLELTTNGTLLDLELAGFLAAHSVDVRLSFDGVELAQAERGLSTFARLDGLLVSLRETLPGFFRHELSVGVTVTAANVETLAASVDYFLARGVRSIVISPRLTPDAAWSVARERQLDEQIARVRGASLERYLRTGDSPAVTFFRRATSEGGPRGARDHCSAGRGDKLTVDVDGRVTVCPTFAASYGALPLTPLGARLAALDLGHVADPGLGGRLAAHRAAARATGLFDPVSKRSSRCRSCPARQECLICPASVAHIPDNDDPHAVPPLPCAFNRVVARHRALFPAQPSLADIITGRANPLPRASD
jgi:sulfatase maturation enzyme AslB (radical SAM superfamily)